MSNKYTFKYGLNKKLILSNPDGVFTPTGTTKALVEGVIKYIDSPGKILDLGCGNGVTGIVMHQSGLVTPPLYISDLSEKAVQTASENALFYECPVVAKSGSIFDPWVGEKFDYILNDISGIAREIAKKSNWFDSVPCNTGEDGSELVGQMLNEAPLYLKENGKLFFPIISLSNVEKILSVARSNFNNIERISRNEWPLPKELSDHKEMLKNLESNSSISVTTKFGIMLYFTDIYVAY